MVYLTYIYSRTRGLCYLVIAVFCVVV